MDTGAIGRPHHAPQLPAGKPQAAPMTDGPTDPIRHPPEAAMVSEVGRLVDLWPRRARTEPQRRQCPALSGCQRLPEINFCLPLGRIQPDCMKK